VTEPKNPATESDSTPDPLENDGRERDFVLQLLAAATQQSTVAEIGLTITVGGTVVTGTLVGRDAWFQALEAWLESQAEGAGSIAGAFSQAFQEDPPVDDPAMFGYLHLKDARFFVGSRMAPEEGTFWRGRISEVSGFSFGTLSTSR
jgi:hypothetical protein